MPKHDKNPIWLLLLKEIPIAWPGSRIPAARLEAISQFAISFCEQSRELLAICIIGG